MPKDEFQKASVVAVHVRVLGKVQGVGFRYFVEAQARRLGVTGWICNSADGAVEAEGQGREEDLKNWLDAIRQGSPFSRVNRVVLSWHARTKDFADFSIRG